MKNFILSVSLFLLFFYSRSEIPKKDIVTFISYSTFYSPEHGSYVEIYLTILGHSLYYSKNENDNFSSTVEITVFIMQDDSIVDFTKISLMGPEIEDTLDVNFSIVDIQRFALPNGFYDIKIKLNDVNSPTGEPFYFTDNIMLDYEKEKINISGIQLVERYSQTVQQNKFSKSGYDLIPLTLNFYPEMINSLPFYCEIYNTKAILGEDATFLLLSYVEHYEMKKIAGAFQTYKRYKSEDVIAFMHEFDISSLPSGNYFLVVEIRDRENNILSSNRVFFQRSNHKATVDYLTATTEEYATSFVSEIESEDELREYIRCLYPIASESEKTFIEKRISSAEREQLQQFFYAFWKNRSDNPQQEWEKYLREVEKVQELYSTLIKKGYQSDRGRVYLQYGQPNTVVKHSHEPSAYPYEIWHYYTLKNQRNRRFIFYNRDLVTNDYELLHSDAIGEIQNPQWQVILHQRSFATFDPDLKKSDWGWGSKVDEYWRNPR